MAKNAVFTVSGIDEIAAAFRELPKRLAKKAIRKAVRESVKPMYSAVRALTPQRTGRLAKATRIRAIAKKKRGSIGIEVRQGEAGFFKGKTYYGGIVNFGSKKRKYAGRHYFERAFDQSRSQVESVLAQNIRNGINQELATLGLGAK